MGLPVYQAAAHMRKALDCLQRQTYENFEAIISVDGNDQETAEACKPFLADPRFRMVVHPTRLDWSGNFNWLLQQELKDAIFRTAERWWGLLDTYQAFGPGSAAP